MTTGSTRRDRGETLVEIVLTVVIISVAVGALVSGLATAANAAGAQRESVVADTTLRNLAEAAKARAGSCVAGAPLAIEHPIPDRWAFASTPAVPTCPPAGSTLLIGLEVSSPADHDWSLDVVVRSP